MNIFAAFDESAIFDLIILIFKNVSAASRHIIMPSFVEVRSEVAETGCRAKSTHPFWPAGQTSLEQYFSSYAHPLFISPPSR